MYKVRKELCTFGLRKQWPNYLNDRDYGILLDSDVIIKAAILSKLYVYGLKFSLVYKFFYLCSLGDKLSRIYPYKLSKAYYVNHSGAFLVPKKDV